jgi:hypothetical protein
VAGNYTPCTPYNFNDEHFREIPAHDYTSAPPKRALFDKHPNNQAQIIAWCKAFILKADIIIAKRS